MGLLGSRQHYVWLVCAERLGFCLDLYHQSVLQQALVLTSLYLFSGFFCLFQSGPHSLKNKPITWTPLFSFQHSNTSLRFHICNGMTGVLAETSQERKCFGGERGADQCCPFGTTDPRESVCVCVWRVGGGSRKLEFPRGDQWEEQERRRTLDLEHLLAWR